MQRLRLSVFGQQINVLFVLVGLNMVLPGLALSYGFVPSNSEQEACFAKAMIGMDSVINSRLGVPAEHALDLSLLNREAKVAKYDSELLNVILAAYLWENSPHSYAVNVFYDCARKHTYQQQAKHE
ncbi:MAG: hypothetical protein OEZ68_14675 [Gammaproteobacteria bacterium]|nr:hypothetical protein [Gammaproteobacteria bacterium]MDH5802048.1 hypothetical protein [Gammaproteobacteria bacterium]